VLSFIGLGNPGEKYRLNRHNLGFMVIDYVIRNLKIRDQIASCKSLIAFSELNNQKLIFAKPLTYMNKSGEAIKLIKETYGLRTEDFIIIYDDLYLPIGKLRIKLKGSDGGHKGIASIIESLQTENIRRIKIGIGYAQIPSFCHPDYVLSDFTEEELEIIRPAIRNCYRAIICIIQEGIIKAQNIFNRNIYH